LPIGCACRAPPKRSCLAGRELDRSLMSAVNRPGPPAPLPVPLECQDPRNKVHGTSGEGVQTTVDQALIRGRRGAPEALLCSATGWESAHCIRTGKVAFLLNDFVLSSRAAQRTRRSRVAASPITTPSKYDRFEYLSGKSGPPATSTGRFRRHPSKGRACVPIPRRDAKVQVAADRGEDSQDSLEIGQPLSVRPPLSRRGRLRARSCHMNAQEADHSRPVQTIRRSRR
jgi:hypothetical protein